MNSEPKSLQEAILYFSNPDNCIDYLAIRRWPDGRVVCPTCGSDSVSAYNQKRKTWKCAKHHPKREFSVKVGSLCEDSAIGLDKWLSAIWLLTNCKNGISSCEVASHLKVTQKTAWFMMHRIRLAMQDETFGKLSGHVEVDETFIGGKARNMHLVKRELSTHATLDRESFQKLLASIFAVQESQMDIQSLSAVVEIQQSITSGDLPVDGAIQLIADCTRNVANATGVAIGLLKGDHLVYRAGSGSAASYTGRHAVATVSVSAGTDTSREILRVENARTDARIEAAICRQFRAEALLILLIYHDRAVAGVLEVLFSEAHAFQDREVRTYRLMAGLVGKAVSHAAQLDQRKALAAELSTVPDPIEQITSQMRKLPSDDVPGTANKHAIYQVCRGAMAVARELPALGQRVWAATMIKQRVKSVPLHVRRWNVAVAAVATALVITCWIAYSDHRPASPLGASALHKSNDLDRQAASVPAKPVPANSMFKPQTRPIAAEEAKAAKSGFKRVRVGENEVDYIAQDVTIRYFTHKRASQRVRVGYNQFDIGEDVTVRYLASKPSLVSATRPVASVVQPVDRSVTVPEQAVSPKLTR